MPSFVRHSMKQLLYRCNYFLRFKIVGALLLGDETFTFVGPRSCLQEAV
jgi:hypothetical protein